MSSRFEQLLKMADEAFIAQRNPVVTAR